MSNQLQRDEAVSHDAGVHLPVKLSRDEGLTRVTTELIERGTGHGRAHLNRQNLANPVADEPSKPQVFAIAAHVEALGYERELLRRRESGVSVWV